MLWLADTITRLRNGYLRNKLEVEVKNSKFIMEVLDCLMKEGYIRGYYKKGWNLVVLLKYKENKSVINKLKIISKPNMKIYSSFKELKKSFFKGEFYVVSSSKGVYLNRECSYKNAGVGGLILFEIN